MTPRGAASPKAASGRAPRSLRIPRTAGNGADAPSAVQTANDPSPPRADPAAGIKHQILSASYPLMRLRIEAPRHVAGFYRWVLTQLKREHAGIVTPVHEIWKSCSRLRGSASARRSAGVPRTAPGAGVPGVGPTRLSHPARSNDHPPMRRSYVAMEDWSWSLSLVSVASLSRMDSAVQLGSRAAISPTTIFGQLFAVSGCTARAARNCRRLSPSTRTARCSLVA
jgi:hypothetical protein